jgi:hypothetical protein
MGWSINAAELRIPRSSRFAAHSMVVIADGAGRAVRQINGLASWYDSAGRHWRHKPIGYLWSDRLRGYDTKTHPRTFMPINGCRPREWLVGPAVKSGAMTALADGLSPQEVDARLAPALEALRRINALSEGPEGGAGLPYPFMGFGRNSNSFFFTMLSAMGFAEPAFANPAWIVPGRGRLLLPGAAIDEVRVGAMARAAG